MASNVKCFMKAVAVVALAGICVLGGYSYAMKYQANSILSALPRPMEDSEIDDTYTPGEDDQEVTVIAQNDISAASEGSWNTVDSYMYDITGDGVNDNITCTPRLMPQARRTRLTSRTGSLRSVTE